MLSLVGLLTVLVPGSVYRSLETGWLPIYTLHCVIYITMLLVVFVPKLASLRLVFVIIAFTLAGMASVLQFGFSALGEIAFVTAMVITALTFGYKGLVILAIVISISILLPPSIGIQPYILEFYNPLRAAIFTLFCGMSASYLVLRLVVEIHLKYQQLDSLLTTNRSITSDIIQLVDTANAPIFGIDSQGMVNEWNQRAEKITGFAKKEVMGRDLVATFITDDYRLSVGEVLGKALKGVETANYEFPLFSKAGNRVDILLNSTTRRDSSGQIVGVVGVGQDITELNKLRTDQEKERQEASAQIIQASKLATLGEMATSVAHELNQPLNVIRLAAENSRRKISTGSADSDYLNNKLNRIEAQTARAATIIEHMRMFGREAKEEPTAIDPRHAIMNALDMVRTQFQLNGIEITTEFPEDCPSILGHVIQLEQVILNLLTNARDAIAQENLASKIIIEIQVDNKQIHIFVEDTGGGIPKEALKKIFEPFFTTKDIGKGTGLGLSVSYGIIRDMGGTIVATNVNDGARFTISLPVIQEH